MRALAIIAGLLSASPAPRFVVRFAFPEDIDAEWVVCKRAGPLTLECAATHRIYELPEKPAPEIRL